MSRTVIEQQMTAMTDELMKAELEFFLSLHPPKDGWEIKLKVTEDNDCWYVRISAQDLEGVGGSSCVRFKLDDVPIIKQHLASTGLLNAGWNEYMTKRAAEETQAYGKLFNEPQSHPENQKMIRNVIEAEIKANALDSVSGQLSYYLSQCLPANGYEVFLEVSNPEGPHFEAVLWAESPKAIRPRLRIDLENVPLIREYLRNTGALRTAYKNYKDGVLEDLQIARQVLMITEEGEEEATITQTIAVSIQRAKTS